MLSRKAKEDSAGTELLALLPDFDCNTGAVGSPPMDWTREWPVRLGVAAPEGTGSLVAERVARFITMWKPSCST